MDFFLDTANIEEIKEAATYGVVDGVTTNPSLIAKEGQSQHEIIKSIVALIDGPISAEVISLDVKGMLAEAMELKEIHPNVVIKLPMTLDGVKCCRELSRQGIKTNVTLVFSANQALVAAKAGATYVSPFIGRLDDVAYDGLELIEDIRDIYDNYGYNTQILAASVRHPLHIKEVALRGANVATFPLSVLQKLYKHPMTDLGLEKFLQDAAK